MNEAEESAETEEELEQARSRIRYVLWCLRYGIRPIVDEKIMKSDYRKKLDFDANLSTDGSYAHQYDSMPRWNESIDSQGI